jgi:hypothetical protein
VLGQGIGDSRLKKLKKTGSQPCTERMRWNKSELSCASSLTSVCHRKCGKAYIVPSKSPEEP